MAKMASLTALDTGKTKREEAPTITEFKQLDVTIPIPYTWLIPYENGVLEYYQRACSKPDFIQKYDFNGKPYQHPCFEVNRYLENPEHPCLQRFQKALSSLKPTHCLQLVFHGTPPYNIEPILQEGLDPSLRYRQAYGPGEYFSEDPLVSLKYACDDHIPGIAESIKILVCVVVLPNKPTESHVVIGDSNHHIPIGTLSVVYTKVRGVVPWLCPTKNQAAMMELRSDNFQKRLLKAGCSEEEKRRRAQQMILLDLANKKIALASHLYQKFSNILIGTDEGAEILNQLLLHACEGNIPESCVTTKFPGLL